MSPVSQHGLIRCQTQTQDTRSEHGQVSAFVPTIERHLTSGMRDRCPEKWGRQSKAQWNEAMRKAAPRRMHVWCGLAGSQCFLFDRAASYRTKPMMDDGIHEKVRLSKSCDPPTPPPPLSPLLSCHLHTKIETRKRAGGALLLLISFYASAVCPMGAPRASRPCSIQYGLKRTRVKLVAQSAWLLRGWVLVIPGCLLALIMMNTL
ncbi:hypothetical protein B0T22DRAFT_132938 [Podospora appendiculata]|uniref:Uncharacterized protein n=1 Tax=Podospora appendiculata TaxID=314037 RepID=A0AAE0X836_9PEZI|nr:hypothetical protein B0T22DRAFT_132938 [Podospora appendiculata]